jgi:outer membrane protein assembly factor BamB/subtilisin family serine protease
MKPLRLRLAALFALLLMSRGLAAEEPISTPAEVRLGYRSHTLLARPKGGANVDAVRLERGEADSGVRLRRALPHVRHLRVMELIRDEDPREAAKRLMATGLYDYVEPDFLVQSHALPNDPRIIDQWHLQNTGQSDGKPGADISAVTAWDTINSAPEVIVAVIDSGVRLTHEDLKDNLWANPGETGGNKEVDSFDNDGNGYIDDVNGINVLITDKNSRIRGSPFDDFGHGSHVAGLIGGAGNNGVGGTGVAWRVKIMALKFLNSQGSGTTAGAVECVNYAVANKAHIINGSFGIDGSFSQALYDALAAARDAGVIYVGSAGNDSTDIEIGLRSPQSFTLDNMILVANTTRRDELAPSSSFGSGLVDIGAPGTDIFSLGIGGDSDYRVRTGTSMAAPIVAGALALLRAKYPDDTPRALINRLLNAADPLPALAGKVSTGARLNLARALLPTTSTAPFNDDFAKRVALDPGIDALARSSTLGATLQAGEPALIPGLQTSGTIWWSWTPKVSSSATIDTAGSTGDTVVAVFTGTTLATLVKLAANDDAAEGTTSSKVDFNAAAGTTYHIAVATKTGAPKNGVALKLSAIPAHDTFANAKILEGVGITETGDTTRATKQDGESLFAGKSRGRSLWYRWVAPATRNYQISVSGIGDPMVGVYTGTSLANLKEIVTDDDSGYATDAYAEFTATAGVTYYIAVDVAASGLAAPFRLCLNDADWQFAASSTGFISAPPAVGPDGTLYLFDELGFLFAVNPDGTRKWRTTASAITGSSYQCTPAVGADGTIYLGDVLGTTATLTSGVYAINPADGARKWRFATRGYNYGSPAVAADGTIYAKCSDGNLYAINPDGTEKWHYAAGTSLYNSPVIGSDGTIYITSFDANLHAIDPDGTRKWIYPFGVGSYATPAIGADGTLYFANYLGRFYAVKPDGTDRWAFDVPEAVSGSAIVGPDGTIYFGSYDRNVYALDGATGKKKWSYLCEGQIRAAAPALGADGTLYIGDITGKAYAIDAQGKLLRTYSSSYGIYSSPVIVGGRLLFGSYDTHLYAFDIGQNSAEGPWPMWRQNLRRVGRAAPTTGLPTLLAAAATRAVDTGSPTVFTAPASATDATPLKYQWRFNGRAIAGATASTYTVTSAQSADVGSYSVLVTGSGGALVSGATALSVTPVVTEGARLINLAVRTTAGSGDKLLTVGLAVGGTGTSGPKPLLIRAVGPTLGAFGVTGTLADPKLELFQGGSPTAIAVNNDWAGDAAVAAITPQVGAFALASATSKDAALLTSRNAGSYTVQISAATGEAGVALAEIYEGTPAPNFTPTTPRLINVSALTRVGTGNDVLIAGFTIGGTGNKRVLVRAVGPTLGGFGVGGVLVDPKLELYRSGTAASISSNDNWGAAANAAEVSTAFTQVGAFALPLDSKDAAMLVILPVGSYTAQVSGLGTTPTGTALVEVYEVP